MNWACFLGFFFSYLVNVNYNLIYIPMKKMKIRSLILYATPLIFAVILGLSSGQETAKASDDICDTWDDYYGYCHGVATNCFCAIIIEG